MKEYGSAGIPRIEIERTGEAVNVIIYTARPGRPRRPQGQSGSTS